jgi:alkylation response protein AidB-like acyl-CoA dehydrogenase
MFITGGEAGDVLAVMCKTGLKEISCIIVEKGTPGLSFGKNEDKLGWNMHPTNLVNFDNVRVPATNLVGKPGIGFKIALQGLEGGRINIASCGIGGAWFALEAATHYMKSREQFGTKISEFQYPRFIMAEAFTKLTVSRILVRHAAHLLDSKNSQKITVGSMSKLYATDNCFEVVNTALQMHGGMGVIKSTGIERVFRDLRILQIVEGTNEIMRLLIARSLFE